MALFHALLRYKDEGRICSFDMLHDADKATVQLAGGKSIVVYMSSDYIVGEAKVREAADPPTAKYLVYNNWDKITEAAKEEANRLGIEIHSFGAFGHRLDKLNAAP